MEAESAPGAQGGQPPHYISPSGTWRTKLCLRIASMVFLVLVAGLGGSIVSSSRVDVWYIRILVLLVPALVVTFGWDLAESLAIWFRAGRRGMHPGAVVAIDLLAWLGWVIVTFATVPISMNPEYYISDYNRDDTYNHRSRSSDVTAEDQKLADAVRAKGGALVSFSALLVITHFMLFVVACQETHKRNRPARVVYVMQPYYGAPPVMVPSAYQQPQSMPMQPPYQYYMQPASQAPAQPPAAHGAETKGGATRYA
ncbi:hypothetical protein BT67DRAFT_434565 [Trichocladium antarcticum]|uniref:MARVEL domain-containing protein n=1 Tax=Trichocladium antarcticum TaxID=1450529 RepID=A0AAN6UJE6_9PEZI|nr:hypothetical protein BT67DRAFT_434565 [Trichocladium antarcticum]